MKFNAGKYYIGDLCYVIRDDDIWDRLLDDTNYFRNESCTFKGYPIFAANTAYGDGGYFDQENREYLVDSGTIGIMPYEAIESDGNGGQIIEFSEDFEVSARNGIFHFGNIKIDTLLEDED